MISESLGNRCREAGVAGAFVAACLSRAQGDGEACAWELAPILDAVRPGVRVRDAAVSLALACFRRVLGDLGHSRDLEVRDGFDYALRTGKLWERYCAPANAGGPSVDWLYEHKPALACAVVADYEALRRSPGAAPLLWAARDVGIGVRRACDSDSLYASSGPRLVAEGAACVVKEHRRLRREVGWGSAAQVLRETIEGRPC